MFFLSDDAAGKPLVKIIIKVFSVILRHIQLIKEKTSHGIRQLSPVYFIQRLIIPIQEVHRPVEITSFITRKQPFMKQIASQFFQVHQTGFPCLVTRIGYAVPISHPMMNQNFIQQRNSFRTGKRSVHKETVIG